MAESEVQITSSGGTRLRTDTKSIGGQTRHQEYMLRGEHSLPAYTATALNLAANTANDHILQLMAGASLPVRIRRVVVTQQSGAGAVSATSIQIVRLSTAGTGGSAVTPRPHDSADAASGASAIALPSPKGTEGVIVWGEAMWFGTGAIPVRDRIVWDEHAASKPIIIPAGVTNGIAVKIATAITTMTVTCTIEFVETTFV